MTFGDFLARGPTRGPLEGPTRPKAQAWPRPDFCKSGNLDLKIWNRYQTKIQVLKIQVHVVQNVDKIWISRKKHFPAPFGAISAHFCMDPKNAKAMPITLGGRPIFLKEIVPVVSMFA